MGFFVWWWFGFVSRSGVVSGNLDPKGSGFIFDPGVPGKKKFVRL